MAIYRFDEDTGEQAARFGGPAAGGAGSPAAGDGGLSG